MRPGGEWWWRLGVLPEKRLEPALAAMGEGDEVFLRTCAATFSTNVDHSASVVDNQCAAGDAPGSNARAWRGAGGRSVRLERGLAGGADEFVTAATTDGLLPARIRRAQQCGVDQMSELLSQ